MSSSLYVHIPFCRKRCIYCDFVSGMYDPEKERAYIKALKKEILAIPPDAVLSTLYIGGGTPTVLSQETLSDLLTHIFRHISFEENYEATIEANPGTVEKEKLQIIRSSGLNRVSIGVQSFINDELSFLGRLHSSDDAGQAVILARSAGFENIGIDLIYGIPGQNIDTWRRTLQEAVNVKPEHISTYELTIEKGTVLSEYTQIKKSGYSAFMRMKWEQGIDKAKPGPLEDEIIEMYNYAVDYLDSEGFEHYEISNFALPYYSCRHNMNYWNRGDYYGAGLGAHSCIRGKRFRNTAILDEYINLISADVMPVSETENISEDRALSEALFLGLRKTSGINLQAFYQTYGKDVRKVYHGEIKELQGAGLLELQDDSIRLTRRGLLLSNEVFVRFM